MNTKKYKKKCKSLFEKATSLGLELQFQAEFFQPQRLNCLWYGGHLAVLKVSSSVKIELNVYGDIYATLYNKRKKSELAFVKDKGNTGRFLNEMQSYIKNDRQLDRYLKQGRLVLENNNWIEYDGVIYENDADTRGQFMDLGIVTDNVLDDNILDAIESVIDNYKNIVTDIDCFRRKCND